MQKMFKTLAIIGIASLTIIGCKKNDIQSAQEQISQGTLDKIYNQGFGISNVQKIDEGYLVEGDIVLTEEFLNSNTGGNFLRIANTEQYRTTNLVSGTRTIKIALDSKLAAKAGYPQALQVVADRYNALGLKLTFQVVSSGADITYVDGHGQFLASAGFPTGGNPYNVVKVNSQSIGTGTTTTFFNFAGTIMAHEAGHCIGFRHTDFYDRSISCGGSYSNEGASTVGAINIPGTPDYTLGDPIDGSSWMLACVSRNQNRPFSSYDKIALNYLYK